MQVPVVTGMKGTHDTPVGRFTIEPSDKIAGTTLVGVNDDQSIYRSYVDYWMPFINQRGIGFHDASWRNDSDFNATTYEYNGSHGCVNMRRADAKKLYQSIRNTMNVIVVAK